MEALTERGKRSACKKAQRHDEREKLEIRRSDCKGEKKEMENELEEKKILKLESKNRDEDK